MKNNIAYIYTLEYPEGNIRYVGQSKNPQHRYYDHIHDISRGTCKEKSNWINSLLEKGFKPILHIWEEVSPENYNREIFYISLFKTWGFLLTNKTDGGEKGKRVSLDILTANEEKLSQYREKFGSSRKGVSSSEHSKELIREYRIKLNNSNLYQFTLKGELVQKWNSSKEVEKVLGFDHCSILRCLKEITYQSHGFIWIKCSDYDKDNTSPQKRIELIKNKYIRKT